MRLHGEHALERAGRAPESAGDRVGINLESLHIAMVDAVRTGRPGAADARLSGFHSRVSAAAVNRPHVTGHEPAVALDSRAHGDHRIVVRVGKSQLFAIGRHDSHRPLRLLRKKIGDRQIARAALAAEVSADGDRVDANFVGRQADGFGQLRSGAERTLAG